MFASFTPDQLATIAAAYFIAALVKGLTGIGYSSTCLPILTFAVGLKEALPLVLLPSVASNLVVMVSAGHIKDTALRFWPMLLSAVLAVFIGIWALTRIDGATAAAVLGVVLMLYVAFALSTTQLRLNPARARPFEPMIGAATGFINGLTGSQVMPVIPYLLSLDLDRDRFIQASNQCFTLSSFAMFAGLGAVGIMNMQVFTLSCAGLLLMVLGVRLGRTLGQHLTNTAFRTAVLCILAVLGASLVLRAL